MHIQWRYLDIAYQHFSGHTPDMLDIKIGLPRVNHWLVRIMLHSPVTITSRLMPLFVKPSTFSQVHIVHPGGGGATRLVCSGCGANYPYVANPTPCPFCAVMKESGIVLKIGSFERSYLWSDHGWAIKCDGEWVGEPNTNPDTRAVPSLVVTRFKSNRKAYAKACEMEKVTRIGLDDDTPQQPYQVSIEPYPLKPIQSMPTDPAIMASIFSGQKGIGAKLGTFGRKQLP